MKHPRIFQPLFKTSYANSLYPEPNGLRLLQEIFITLRMSFSASIREHKLDNEELFENIEIPTYEQDRINLKSDRVKVIGDYKNAVDYKKLELID